MLIGTYKDSALWLATFFHRNIVPATKPTNAAKMTRKPQVWTFPNFAISRSETPNIAQQVHPLLLAPATANRFLSRKAPTIAIGAPSSREKRNIGEVS